MSSHTHELNHHDDRQMSGQPYGHKLATKSLRANNRIYSSLSSSARLRCLFRKHPISGLLLTALGNACSGHHEPFIGADDRQCLAANKGQALKQERKSHA